MQTGWGIFEVEDFLQLMDEAVFWLRINGIIGLAFITLAIIILKRTYKK